MKWLADTVKAESVELLERLRNLPESELKELLAEHLWTEGLSSTVFPVLFATACERYGQLSRELTPKEMDWLSLSLKGLAKAPATEALYSAYTTFIRRTVEVMGNAGVARTWLDTPNESFNGKAPLAFASEVNFDLSKFEPYFIRLEHGLFS